MPTRTARYKYRAYPSGSQEQYLAGLFGATRVVYNSRIYDRELVFKQGLSRKPLDYSRNIDVPTSMDWMKDYSNAVRQQARRDADQAYQNFFRGLKGGPKRGKPKYKKRSSAQSVRWCGAGNIAVKQLNRKWAAVRIPKEGSWLKFRLSRGLPSAPTSVTLSKSASGQYHVSFVVQQPIATPKSSGTSAGVDPGLIDLVTVVKSNGERYKVSAPRHLRKAERRLASAQRELSRKKRGSKNREKARRRVAEYHRRVADSRLDLTRKIAFRLASENQAVSLEDLKVSGLGRGRLAKSFSDAGLSQLLASVEQASEKLGASCVRVPAAYTTMTCSVCRVRGVKRPLSQRSWECSDCGSNLDRDFNAAVNILDAGHAHSLNGSGGNVRRQLAGAVPIERVTSLQSSY